MFCFNCGNQLSDDARVCDKCGIPIEAAAEVKPVEETVVEPAVKPAAPETPVVPAAPAQRPVFVQTAAPGYQTYQTSPGYMPPQQYAPRAQYQEESKWMGVLSLVCGIVSIVLCSFPFIPVVPELLAVIFGIVGIVKKNGKGMAIAGLVLGALAFFATVFSSLILGAVLLDEILGEFYYDYFY